MSNETVINSKCKKLTLRDGKEYTVRPLSINELISVWPIIKKLEDNKDAVDVDTLESIKKLATVALGDQIVEGDVGDLVDMVDIQEIIAAIMGQAK